MLQVSIYRYNPETDSEPYMQDVQVDTGGQGPDGAGRTWN